MKFIPYSNEKHIKVFFVFTDLKQNIENPMKNVQDMQNLDQGKNPKL